jgi:hypothetical protein
MAASGGSKANKATEAAVERVREASERLIETARQGGEQSLDAYERLLGSLAEAQESAGSRGAEWIQAIARAQASFTRELAAALPSALSSLTSYARDAAETVTGTARRVPGAAAVEGEVKGAVAHEDELPIKGYDKLKVGDITSRLDKLSTTDLGKVDAYERRTKNRKTVLDKIRSLR